MAKTKKKDHRHVQVRLTPQLYMALDRVRGPMSRQQWIKGRIEQAAKA
jgi:hypothetical protein